MFEKPRLNAWQLRRLRRYAFPALAAAVALGAKQVADHLLAVDTTFVFLPAAIALSALYNGLGPGLVATVLIAVAPTVQQGAPLFTGTPHGVWLVVAGGAVLSLLCATARKTKLNTSLQRDLLEERVGERTRRLAAANSELLAEATRRQVAQEELERQKSQLHVIADALPVIVAEINQEKHFYYINSAGAAWYRRTSADIIGRHLSEVMAPEPYEALRGPIEQALGGEYVTFERTTTALGSTRQVTYSHSMMPELEANGRVTGFVWLCTDITKHKEIEEELRRAKEASDSANRTKTVFLANMSHEIRTPLGAVLGFSELLLDQTLPLTERDRCVDTIRRNGNLLLSIINDILDVSKVEAGKVEIESTDVNLLKLLEDVTVVLNFQASEKGLQFHVVSEGRIPERIRTDPTRLRQVLTNIAGNAIKFTRQGSVSMTVQCLPALDEKPARLAFIVRDTGPGIAPEAVGKLFEPFTQLDMSTTRKFGGTGLGLALSKRLAKLLGGDLELTESVPGQGSTFVVTIDPGKVAESRLPPLSPGLSGHAPAVAKEAEAQLSGLHVLLVEDGVDNQILFSRLLRRAGAEVDVAEHGRAGVDMASGGAYDLVLMDLQMPVMDGYEATAELRRRGYRGRILALTAHALREERERTLSSGFDGHLSKPIDRLVLIRRLAEVSRGDLAGVADRVPS